MATMTATNDTALANSHALMQQDPDAWFEQKFSEMMAKREAEHIPSMAIIVTRGTLDWAYPPFILASSASALGWDVSMFFTFYGLSLLKKNLDLKITPVGNPAMPMRSPVGPDWLKKIDWKIPGVVQSNMPGFESMAKNMMEKKLAQKGVASIEELREISLEAGVKMIACQMTVDLFDWDMNDFVPEVNDWVGATFFLPTAQQADVSLFM